MVQGEKRDENEDTHTYLWVVYFERQRRRRASVSPDVSTLPASHPSANIENVWQGTRVQAWLLHHKSKAA